MSSASIEESEEREVKMDKVENTEAPQNSAGESSGNREKIEEQNVDDSHDADNKKDQKQKVERENADSCDSEKSQFDIAVCTETIPGSSSNKENFDSNNYIEFDPSEYIFTGECNFSDYDNADQIPLPQLLKMHVKQLVSGFEFGEATKRRAQENMKTARDRKKSENRKSGDLGQTETDDATDMPCCSKAPETEHKTPHSRKRQRLAESKTQVNPDRDFSKATRRIPDCLIDHPVCKEVWMFMIFKEEATLKLRNPRLFNDFKSVTPRMRAILLDWLMEVAAVYHLRRVTYYLSVDYFDRFLSIRPDIPKSLLQLVGITCLYIAAKVEEIYPPNLSEFSYVCDGACKAKDMVSCELLILNSLGWEVVLTTPSDWLNLYMQLYFKSKDLVRTSLNMDFNKDFIFPQYSAFQFTRASQLMDLLSLDPGFLKFGYSVVAASAMYYMYGPKVALSVSGLSWQQLQPCVNYMEVFYTIIKDTPDPRLLCCLGDPHPEEMNKVSNGLLKRAKCGPQNENYSFQTHVASMDYFEKATIFRLSRYNRQKPPQTEEAPKSEGLKPNSQSEEKTEGANNVENAVKEEVVNELEELNSLEKLADGGIPSASEQETGDNLLSLDEIFELILSQDDRK